MNINSHIVLLFIISKKYIVVTNRSFFISSLLSEDDGNDIGVDDNISSDECISNGKVLIVMRQIINNYI